MLKIVDENVTVLNYQEKEIILIGTAHVSKESVALVKQVIDSKHPDSICIELDKERYKNMQNPKAWEDTNVIDVIKSKKVGLLLANLALSVYQKNIAKNLDTNVGQEMLQGIESSKELGCELVLADRNIQTTFLRIWRKMNLWKKGKLLVGLLFSFNDDKVTSDDLNELMEKDNLEEAMLDIRKQFPQVGEILISERDQYLANKIKNAPGNRIVAILGAAHVVGVKEEIFKEQDMDSITQVPPGSPISKIIGWAIPICIIAMIVYGFTNSFEMGVQQMYSWILWNGVLSAIGTALVLGHPLSILTAFVAAPITSLNPLLACGWFAGLMEATIRKPTVGDVNNVSKDISSFKGFFKNRFLKTLLIVIVANLGSTIGTFTAGLNIFKNIF
jgi:pheromone shutdown-related protein TraB